MERVVSGIRPTGHIHLGNYFGAIKNFVEMQHQMDCFFFIADFHSLTTHPKAEQLHANVKEVLATYLACGIDPEKATLYVQSDLPQIPELYLLMNNLAYVGELERSTTYKDKIAKQQDNINAGLLTYPVLMAVDVIIHKATKVPVGKDQEQHLEMARTYVNRFNHLYNVDFFPECHAFNFGSNLVKIPGLDGNGKMGKSEGEKNAIYLSEDPESIRKKVMKAVTDTGTGGTDGEMPEAIKNLFALMNAVSAKETEQYFRDQYTTGTIRYGDLKKQLAEDMIIFTSPIREKLNEYMADEATLSKIVRLGAEKARASASDTLKSVREIIGLKSF